MRRLPLIAVTALLVSACGSPKEAHQEDPAANDIALPPDPLEESPTPRPADSWALQASGEGSSLVLLWPSGGVKLRLSCPAGAKQLLVNVPGFRPIGSEERLSFGSGGDVTALVADPGGDRERGGVTATGAVPGNLAPILAGEVSASYGAQASGPHPAPPQELSRAFVGACSKGGPAASPAASAGTSACMLQEDKRLDVKPLRAVGTEPFWGARIEGRCVTYSHPEDQQGTRIWTRYTPAPGGGIWSGTLDHRKFELKTRAAPGCSDGMSDRKYPVAVELLVGGEERKGCAEPL